MTQPYDAAAAERRNWAMWAHLAGVFNVMFAPAGLMGALIAYSARRSDPFVRENARNALNAQITMMASIAVFFAIAVATFLMAFLPAMTTAVSRHGSAGDAPPLVGFAVYFGSFAVMFGLLFGAAVMSVIGAVRANGGHVFRYFYAFPFVR